MANSPDESVPTPGRPVHLVPAPRGLWPVLIGVAIAALAPLFGFLTGTAMGPQGGTGELSPLYLGLLIGVVIGAFGVLLAIVGGVRLYRTLSARQGAEAPQPAP